MERSTSFTEHHAVEAFVVVEMSKTHQAQTVPVHRFRAGEICHRTGNAEMTDHARVIQLLPS